MSVPNQSRLHELTVEQVVLAGAAPEVFNAFRAGIVASLKPEGELELSLSENIVVAQWGLRRCRIAETSLATGKTADPLANEHVYPQLRQLDATVRRHERSLERHLRLLRQLQTEREFRRLAKADPDHAPLAESAKVRRAFVAEQSAKLRFNNASMRTALDQFLNQPAGPSPDVTFERFREE